jgi:GNAT superfamily N-acetyltransferase
MKRLLESISRDLREAKLGSFAPRGTDDWDHSESGPGKYTVKSPKGVHLGDMEIHAVPTPAKTPMGQYGKRSGDGRKNVYKTTARINGRNVDAGSHSDRSAATAAIAKLHGVTEDFCVVESGEESATKDMNGTWRNFHHAPTRSNVSINEKPDATSGTHNLSRLKTDLSHRNRGGAQKVMSAATAHADKHGMNLHLYVVPDNDDDHDRLEKFYGKHGFVRGQRGRMVRQAQSDMTENFKLLKPKSVATNVFHHFKAGDVTGYVQHPKDSPREYHVVAKGPGGSTISQHRMTGDPREVSLPHIERHVAAHSKDLSALRGSSTVSSMETDAVYRHGR